MLTKLAPLCGRLVGRVPLHTTLRHRSSFHVDSFDRTSVELMIASGEDAAVLAAHQQALKIPDVQGVMAEWRTRRDSIDQGDNDLLGKTLAATRASGKDVFVLNDLFLSEIDALGYDFDYTLLSYQPTLHEFIYSAALKILVEKRAYPPELLTKLSYSPDFAIRGLVFDPSHGNLLKLDAMSRVEVAFFGRKALKRRTINQLYNGTGMLTASHVSSLRMMADLFCLSEACLVADLIGWLAQTNLTFVPAYIYADVVQAVSDVHASGLLYSAVMKNPSKFVDPPKHMASYFQRLKDAGKKTFILSNSPLRYIDALMMEFYGPSWAKNLFDIVVVEAKKPSFFQGDRPFRRVNPFTSRVDWAPVDKLPLPADGLGNVVCNGNLKSFADLTGWKKVLFSGDHIEADAKEPRRYGWRSAVLLPELERDIQVQNSEAYRVAFTKLLECKDFLSNVFRCKPGLTKEAKEAILRELTLEMEALRAHLRGQFGSPFGSVFSSASSSSAYGLMLLRWADAYCAGLDSFAAHPVDAFLSAGGTTRALPHDVRVSF